MPEDDRSAGCSRKLHSSNAAGLERSKGRAHTPDDKWWKLVQVKQNHVLQQVEASNLEANSSKISEE